METITPGHGIETGTTANGQKVTTLYKTRWNDGTELTEPQYLKAWYFTPGTNDTEVTREEILKEIELNDWSRWNTGLKPGAPVEISEAIYFYMLECLPPRNWIGSYFEVGEPHHHDDNGRPVHRAFWQDEETKKYYTSYPKRIITRERWNKIPKDYKGVRDGRATWLTMEEGATTLLTEGLHFFIK